MTKTDTSKGQVWNVRPCCPHPSFEYTKAGKPKGRCFSCDTAVKVDAMPTGHVSVSDDDLLTIAYMVGVEDAKADVRAKIEALQATVDDLTKNNHLKAEAIEGWTNTSAAQDQEIYELKATVKEMREALWVASQLAEIASDWNLEEVEIDGEMHNIYDVKQVFTDILAKEQDHE